jgi:hypothetical protein
VLFHFDFSNYFKMLRLAWNEKTPAARYYYLVVLLLWVPVVSSFHAICFFLDGLLFPGMLRIEVKQPIFMVGHARSGTTLAHRLLSKDEGRFSSFMLYELYFPSLLQKRVIRAVAAFDRRHLGRFLEKRVQAWEAKRYTADAHKMGLTIPEEDDIIFYYSMASGFWITKMPYMGDLDFYNVDAWPERKRRRLHDFYRNCVRRQLYLNGPEKTHLSKNPVFAGRVAALIESFPDARIVVNVRNPNETIPSLLKLLSGGYKRLGWDEEKRIKTLRILADQSYHTYAYPLEVLEQNPGVPSSVVEYRDLVSDPASVVERIYQDLGLEMTDGYRELLMSEGKRSRSHATSHRYSLEEFGLDATEIQEELADLFERFQWEKAESE